MIEANAEVVGGFDHTYYVGGTSTWVHNASEQARDALGRFLPKSGGEAIPGSAGVEQVRKAIEQKKGWKVIGEEISFRDSKGQLRRYDLVAESPSGRQIGIEVKSGSATKTAAQRRFDTGVNSRRGLTQATGRKATALQVKGVRKAVTVKAKGCQ